MVRRLITYIWGMDWVMYLYRPKYWPDTTKPTSEEVSNIVKLKLRKRSRTQRLRSGLATRAERLKRSTSKKASRLGRR